MTTRTRLTARLGVVAVLALVMALISVMGPASAVEVQPVEKVTICHHTSSAKNPYVMVTPNVSSIVGTHGHMHDLLDIIPDFAYEDHGELKTFPGLNWDAEGRAILENGCKVPGGPDTYQIIPVKVWAADYGEGFGAVITITPTDGVTPAKSWTFDHEGKRNSDDPLTIPAGVDYLVTEVVNAPSDWSCSLTSTVVGDGLEAYHGKPVVEPMVVTLTNTCVRRETPPTIPPVTFPPVTVTTPELETTTTTLPEEVAGEVVEETTTTVVAVAAEALPRTGGSAALGLVAAGLLGLGGGLVATARRRELKS